MYGKKITFINKKIIENCRFGQAILISNRIFHGGTPNISKNFRNTLVLGYIAKGASYKIGKTIKRKAFKI